MQTKCFPWGRISILNYYLTTLHATYWICLKTVTMLAKCVLTVNVKPGDTSTIINLVQTSCLNRAPIWPVSIITNSCTHSSIFIKNTLKCEISPTRCNNCVFYIRNGFTLHVSGDNLTHHHEYNAVYGHRWAGSLRLLLNLSVVK